MLNQQIESLSNKFVQFLQDLTYNIQTSFVNENLRELFQLRCDYAKQLACLFESLIRKFIDEYQQNSCRRIQIDPVQIWRSIQILIDQLTNMQCNEIHSIIQSIRNLNKYFYNLLVQIQNFEFLKVDQLCSINRNLIEELNCLADNLNNYSASLCSKNQSTINPCAMNTNCCQLNPKCLPNVDIFPCSTSMGARVEIAAPLCFSTPIVYTPEMETLFSSGGIIYARKSGNTWIAENLGTLIETLKDIGENIDINEHSEILVRKTGELLTRRKRGRKKRF